MNLTKRSELRRIPVRGSHDWDTVGRILDVGFLAHVGFCVSAQPFVIPTLYGREGDKLYLHGSAASRMLGELEIGIPACVTVTLVDGLIAICLRPFHELSLRCRFWNGEEDRGSGRESHVFASHFRAPHRRPLG